MKKIKRSAAAVLALMMAVGGMDLGGAVSGFPGAAGMNAYGAVKEGETSGSETEDAETKEVVIIDSARALIEMSKACVFDDYSEGKIFELTGDIDLSGSGYTPAASFGGTFKGNGYTISGLYLDKKGGDVGLFRFVEPSGVIENLTVRGTVRPEGSRKNVGGIAGTNRGRISGCTFIGKVEARENTGGIAGFNEAGGLIESCTNQAVISGLNATGGIAGLNEGIVESCLNKGEVNTSEQASESEETGSSDLSLDGAILDAEKVYHTGGIVGRSTGTIRSSRNEAAVGYLHSGYNTGGIAGIQNGLIAQCVNSGEVRGRKDTGGIVGQFEPYVQMWYQEDTIQKVQNEIDVLLDQLGALADTAMDTSNDTVANTEGFRDSLKEVRSGLQSNKQYYYDQGKEFSKQLDSCLDNLSVNIDDFGLELSNRNTRSDARDLHSQLERLETLRKELKGALITDPLRAKEILDEMAELMDEIENTVRDMPVSLIDDVNDTADDLNGQIDSIRESAKETRELIRENKDKLFDDLKVTDEDMSARIDAASASMDVLADRLKDANAETQDQIREIRSQINRISDTIDGEIEEVREKRDKDLINDVSEEEAEEAGSGMVIKCTNEGMVESDSNVGGIAGIIGMELSFDPENDVEIDGDTSLRIDRTARAVVQGCINRMDVVSTNDYAGGIVGRADAGALRGNCNYGDVKTVNGSYAGGIAGSSSNVVRDNFSLCQLTGKNYVGGIVGKGEHISGNYAMVSVFSEEEGEFCGAVAGDADGEVHDNYFVWEGLPAINGVTYQEQASSLSYEELLAMQGIPEEFRSFEVQFIADGKVLGRVNVRYKEAVPASKIPEIPARPGYYAFWEDKGQDRGVNCNLRVYAQYRLWTTAIASDWKVGEMPVLLAEGAFYPGTALLTEAADPQESWQAPEGWDIRQGYRYQLSSPETADGSGQNWDAVRLRVYAGELEHKRDLDVAALREDGSFVRLHAEKDGSYLVFPASGEQGTFVILEESHNWYLLGAGIAAVALLAAWYLGRRRRVMSGRETGQEREQEPYNHEE